MPEIKIPRHKFVGILELLSDLPPDLLLAFIQHISGESELVHPGLVFLVDVSLVEENEEDDVISEAAKSVHGRHLDDECEDVVNEGVESLIGHHPPTKL